VTITKTIPAINTATGRPRYSSRGGAKVRLLILHTMEGARTVEACGSWFRNPDAPNASSHVGIDDDDTALYVPYEYSAWTAASANPVADQAELAAFAAWTPAEWDTHAGMIERTAQWVAERAKARGIPLVRLRDKQTKTGTGVCMHVDITRGWGVGTHQDCGANFPIDRIIARAIQINTVNLVEDIVASLNDDEKGRLMRAIDNYNRTWDEMQESKVDGKKLWLADALMFQEANVAKVPALLQRLVDKLGA